jgi:hypothetical protein
MGTFKTKFIRPVVLNNDNFGLLLLASNAQSCEASNEGDQGSLVRILLHESYVEGRVVGVIETPKYI